MDKIKIRKKKQNKGMISSGLMLLYRLPLLFIALGIFLLFANMLLSPFPDITQARGEVLLGRVLYDDALHYKQPFTQRVYNNIIDLDKLTNKSDLEDYLNSEFYSVNRKTDLLLFRLQASYQEGNQRVTKEIYSDKDQFLSLSKLSSKSGPGAVTEFYREYPSKCKVNDKIISCEIVLQVLIPNS